MISHCQRFAYRARSEEGSAGPDRASGVVDDVDLLSTGEIETARGTGAVQIFRYLGGRPCRKAGFDRWGCRPGQGDRGRALRRRHPGVPVIGFPRGRRWGSTAAYRRQGGGRPALGLDTEGAARAGPPRRLQPVVPSPGHLDPVLLLGAWRRDDHPGGGIRRPSPAAATSSTSATGSCSRPPPVLMSPRWPNDLRGTDRAAEPRPAPSPLSRSDRLPPMTSPYLLDPALHVLAVFTWDGGAALSAEALRLFTVAWRRVSEGGRRRSR